MVQRNIKNINRFNEIKRKINLARYCIYKCEHIRLLGVRRIKVKIIISGKCKIKLGKFLKMIKCPVLSLLINLI